ncbi:MAG: hypothetical protein C0422_13625 [Alcaligenaceae bacterium]|nr:hypothetical protein [Alcaligenaceae bacterium]
MIQLLLGILIFFAFAAFLFPLVKNRAIINNYPALMSAVYLGWALPQVIALQFTQIPNFGLESLCLIMILSLIAAVLGKNLAEKKWISYGINSSSSIGQLINIYAFVYLISGSYFYLQVSRLSEEATLLYGGFWTGAITIYAFLSKLLSIGFVMSVISYLRGSSWINVSFILYGLTFYLNRIVIHGRRAELIELAMIGLYFYFIKNRKSIGSKSTIFLVFCAALFVNNAGEYRNATSQLYEEKSVGEMFSAVLEIQFLDNFLNIASGTIDSSEIRNAAMNLAAVNSTLNLDYGLSLWNTAIKQFVPGQIIGHELKDSLLFTDFSQETRDLFLYESHPGSTQTGFSDAYRSFWILGFFKFFFISYLLTLFIRRSLAGDDYSKIYLVLTVVASLQAVTHSTDQFFVQIVIIFIFLLPVRIHSRRRI